MDDRRRTLLTLIELASDSTPSACWDDQRAAALLRSQSTPEELKALGAADEVIGWVFAGNHAR